MMQTGIMRVFVPDRKFQRKSRLVLISSAIGGGEQMAELTEECQRGGQVPLSQLFVALLKVSLYGIGGGGGVVWSRRIAVEQRRWINEQDFADIVSLCQFMPGPNSCARG